MATQSRQLCGRWESDPPKDPSEASSTLKTKTIQKIDYFKAGNILKTNTVGEFSPNVNENKGGYAPNWLQIDAPVITTAIKLPNWGPSGAIAPPIQEVAGGWFVTALPHRNWLR